MPVNAFPKSIYTNDSSISYYQNLVLDDGTWTYNVEAIQRNTHESSHKHKELLVNRNKLPVSR